MQSGLKMTSKKCFGQHMKFPSLICQNGKEENKRAVEGLKINSKAY